MRSLPGPAARGVCLAAGWLGGLAWQLQQPALPTDAVLWGLAASSAFALAILWRWRRGLAVTLLMSACVALLAYASTGLRAAALLQDALPAALEGQDLVVTGTVAELPRASSIGTRFLLQTESATWRGAPVQVPGLLSLGWYRSPGDDPGWAGLTEALRAGQRWRLAVRLRQPHGGFNPQGFDLELWLFERGIRASGSVRSAPAPLKLAEAAGHPVERLRQALRDALVARVADPVAAGVLAALAIGDQAAIDREGWDLFRITGVAHLMSISGLHVTMFAWLAGALIGRLWRRSTRAMLWLPAPQAARWGGLIAAAGYALLAGWGVPAQRTVWMIAVVVALRSAGLRWPLHLVLLAAAVVVTLGDPWALLQPGFWLSFVAVALLVAAEPVQALAAPAPAGRSARQLQVLQVLQVLRGGLRTQLVATVGLAPLTLVFFQQLSLVGFVANLVAIPVVTLLITPLALLGVLLPPLWSLAAWGVQALMALLTALAGWPLAVWSVGAAPLWAMACGLLAGALALLPLPLRLRLLALPLALPLLLPHLPRPPEGDFELVAADIGQGTAVLLRTRGHLLVFDAGPAYTPDADAGSRVLLPLLRVRGDPRIDRLMLSHRDGDHVGGAASLLAGVPVAQLDSSLEDGHPLLAQAAARAVPVQRCQAGQSWQWDGVQFTVLHPLAADYERPLNGRPLKPNAMSCVLRVQGRHTSALLTGDIEAAQEAALLQREAAALRADALLVPHHGSRTSSTPAFIDAVQPRWAIVQAAYRSRFGHPAPDVVARYESRGIALLRSDRCGAWTLSPALAPRCEREAARRYWHHPGPVADRPPPARAAP